MATDWSPSPKDPASGVKAAGIEIGPGIMRQYAGLDWSMSAGSGASEIGMANKRADNLFIWGGGSPTAAKIRMWMDGSARFDQIMIGNSGVNQFTQMYPYTDADNADAEADYTDADYTDTDADDTVYSDSEDVDAEPDTDPGADVAAVLAAVPAWVAEQAGV